MKHKYRNLFIVILTFFLAITTIPSVLGKTRGSYLTSFLLNNEIIGEGFSNAIFESEPAVSFEATSYALDILDNYGIKPHDIETLTSKLEDDINEFFSSADFNLYDLFFLMNSLKVLDTVIDSSIVDKVSEYLNITEQATGGFSNSNNTKIVSMASTYYSFRLFSIIEKPIENTTIHKNWVLSCYNNDGGYGSNQSLSSTLVDTCFAVYILEELGEIGALNSEIYTIGYLHSFFVMDTDDPSNLGGYLPNENAQYALLSSTYLCVKAISIIDDTKIFKGYIRNWVLAHQNFRDGGFVENTEGSQETTSSVLTSYYAFETLRILDSLSSLHSEIWTVQFNYWILIIVLGSIGLVIVAAVFLYKRTRL